jgi:hypothetical protein
MLKPYQVIVVTISDLMEQILLDMSLSLTNVELRVARACSRATGAFTEVPRQYLPKAIAIRVKNLEKFATNLGLQEAASEEVNEERCEAVAREIIMLYADLISTAREWKGPK